MNKCCKDAQFKTLCYTLKLDSDNYMYVQLLLDV